MSLSPPDVLRIEAEVSGTVDRFLRVWAGREPSRPEDLGAFLDRTTTGYGTGADEVFPGDPRAVERVWAAEVDDIPEGFDLQVRDRIIDVLGPDVAMVSVAVDLATRTQPPTRLPGVRISLVLRGHAAGVWRMVHIHGSIPWMDQALGEAWPTDALKARAEQLEREVQARTEELTRANRELRIEAAVERVRAQALAMRSPDDLFQVADALRRELAGLDVPGITGSGLYLVDERDVVRVWDLSAVGERGDFEARWMEFDPRDYPTFGSVWKEWKDGKPYFELHMDAEGIRGFVEELKSLQPEAAKAFEPAIASGQWTQQWFAGGSFSHGWIGSDLYAAPDTWSERIHTRMAGAFGIAYRRFQDLQAVERRAREARIEAALERLRAAGSAMHSSDDIGEASIVLFDQLRGLGIVPMRSGISIPQGDGTYEFWAAAVDEEGVTTRVVGHESVDVHPVIRRAYHGWECSEPVQTVVLEGQGLAEYYAAVFPSMPLPDWKQRMEAGDAAIEHFSTFPFTDGWLYLFMPDALSDGDSATVRRFTDGFDLTYRRYKELVEAEARAREAEIEAALERVRARAMTMQSATDIADTTRILFEEIRKLCPRLLRLGVNIRLENGSFRAWGVYTDAEDRCTLALSRPYRVGLRPEWDRIIEAWDQGEESEYVVTDEYAAFIRREMVEEGDPEQIGGMFSGAVMTTFPHRSGYLSTTTERPLSPDDEERSIVRRFGAVFDLAYKRYRDLQAAEEAAREARVEAALERVRAQAMAMRESSDLLDIVVTMRSEFLRLGHEAHYFWHMRWLPTTYEKAMTSGDGTRIGMVMELPRGFHENAAMMAWERNDEPVGVFTFDVDRAIEYVHRMVTTGRFDLVDPNAPTDDDIRHIGGLTFVMARTTHGEIGYSLPGFVPEPPVEDLQTLERFAGVFDLAYRRFEDLQRVERDNRRIVEEKERAERALADLHTTQAQLIEQEKLASLGSLTAGIAHEIKNPLNFVNNFAEVNAELADELAAAIANGDMEEAAALLNDLRENAAQIARHGKRADGIVRAMMQHARGGTSRKETIDVNEFLEEYTALAWHGMRAREEGFAVEVVRDFANDAGTIEALPQELGRVVLNLLNNAFDALRGRDGARVVLRSRRTETGVEFTVQDNGPGIPPEIREKIFEPFFTTKPTGEGTGLGLSLSYDIVTKGHGGTMRVEETVGGGATFVISLPTGG